MLDYSLPQKNWMHGDHTPTQGSRQSRQADTRTGRGWTDRPRASSRQADGPQMDGQTCGAADGRTDLERRAAGVQRMRIGLAVGVQAVEHYRIPLGGLDGQALQRALRPALARHRGRRIGENRFAPLLRRRASGRAGCQTDRQILIKNLLKFFNRPLRPAAARHRGRRIGENRFAPLLRRRALGARRTSDRQTNFPTTTVTQRLMQSEGSTGREQNGWGEMSMPTLYYFFGNPPPPPPPKKSFPR
jgi:hypothetical protein